MVTAALVATFALATATRAVQTTVTPNAAIVGYSLAAGANSGAITPPASQAVHVMGVCNTLGTRGVGFVELLRVPGSFLEWVGLDSTAGAAITQGFSAAAGTKIVFLDFSHQVAIQVNSADTFRIHNGATAARAGNVTLIW
jgi:hypothetical protein